MQLLFTAERQNIALDWSRRVYQSSTEIRNRQWVNAAIDCVDNSNRKFCRTLQESNPWWIADLGYQALTEKVKILRKFWISLEARKNEIIYTAHTKNKVFHWGFPQ